MSHFTEIETQIRDAEALREACTELGLELLENAEARGFNGMVRRGEYVVRLKGPYDIALNRQSDGSYSLEADHWNGHVERDNLQIASKRGQPLNIGKCPKHRIRPPPPPHPVPQVSFSLVPFSISHPHAPHQTLCLTAV